MRSRAIVVMAVLGSSLVTGGWLLERGFAETGNSTTRARLFDNVMSHITRFYVDSLSEKQLWGKAVDGMLQELRDPHTVFLEPKRLTRLTESTTGNYGGVGIQIDARDGWITVVAPLPGTPAERAGVQTGDKIVEVEGKTTRGWTVEEARNALRGTPGTSVNLVLERTGAEEPIALTLTRREIHRSAVQRPMVLREGVGYVDVDVFSESTADELRRTIDSLQAAGLTSLIIDLRSNPGGLLSQGVAVTDLFLDSGQKIVSMRGRVPEANREFVDGAAQRWRNLPLVVLINEQSASASEILAGALQDHDRGIVIGRASFGKGSAQTLYHLPTGGALKLTTARWFTPIGRSIDKPRDDADGEGDDESVPARAPETPTKFKTQGGRTLHGGGGITPDIVVGDTAIPPAEAAFSTALGQKVGQFLDAVTSYALALRAQRTITSPDFTITPEMREELWRRMRERGVVMDRAVYDAAVTPSRRLGWEIARYVFGTGTEARRIAGDDPQVQAALDLLRGVRTREELLSKAATRYTPLPAKQE